MTDRPKISALSAGYMELPGAVKDTDCHIVEVKDGVASRKGCCNLYRPKAKADEFRCGECIYVASEGIVSLMLRHGETKANEGPKIFRGRRDYPLDEDGRKMAEKAGKWLQRNADIKQIVSSPLKRAKDTAGIVAKILGIGTVHTTPLLLPFDPGDLTGKERTQPNLKLLDYYIEHPTLKIPGGSQTHAEWKDDLRSVFELLKAPGTLAVSHSSVIGEIDADISDKESVRPGDTEVIEPGGLLAIVKTEDGYDTLDVFGGEREGDSGN